MADHDRMRLDGLASTSELLHGLSDEQWDEPSLCEGWRVRDVSLHATDVEWTHGDGPEVRGTGEAILLAATGRPVVLPELEGDGVERLRERVAA